MILLKHEGLCQAPGTKTRVGEADILSKADDPLDFDMSFAPWLCRQVVVWNFRR